MKQSELDYKTLLHNERSHFILIIAGFTYFIWLKITHIGIPCVFRLITGWKCPGCGITHMIIDLFHGEFSQAFHANALLALTWPFIIIEWIAISMFRRNEKTDPIWNEALLYVYIAITCSFGILRNIYGW